jgi:hypothetical protein
MKQISRKLRKMKKKKVTHRRKGSKRRRVHAKRRGSSFGSNDAYQFSSPSNYGYNQKVEQYPQTLSQSSMVNNAQMNIGRPEGLGLPASQTPVYGVYRNFFGQDVPTQVPPNYNFMGQPDGTLYAVGSPFQRYTTPNSFGKKRRIRMYNVSGSKCQGLKKKVCQSNPNCTYTKKGCRRRSGTVTKGLVYEGPSLQSFGNVRARRFGFY